MNYEYLDFVAILAFESILNFDTRHYITLEQLKNYKNFLYEEAKKSIEKLHEIDEKTYDDELKCIIDFDVEDALPSFLERQKALFYFEDGKIYLKEDIHTNAFQIHDYLCSLPCRSIHLRGIFISFSKTLEGLEILGLSPVIEKMKAFLDLEKELEKLYLMEKTPTTLNQLNLYQALEMSKLLEYDKLSDSQAFSLMHMPFYILKREREKANKDATSTQKDKQGIYLSPITFFLSDAFQKAIFFDDALYEDKVSAYFYYLYCQKDKEEDTWGPELEPLRVEGDDLLTKLEALGYDTHCPQFDEDEDYDDDEEDEEDYDEDDEDEEEYDNEEQELGDKEETLAVSKSNYAFYLTYISMLDRYQNVMGKDTTLEKVKAHLLYLLDNYSMKLWMDSNLEEHMKTSTILDPRVAYNYEEMAAFYLEELQEEGIKDDLAIRKILLVRTYYELTDSKHIKSLLEKESSDKEFLSKMILDPLEDKSLSNDIKTYQKRFKDSHKH